jgi:hypothetical protein
MNAPTLPKLKKKVKEEFDKPDKDIKCFIFSYSLDEKYKYPLMMNVTSETITPKLSLVFTKDDVGQTFTYSKKELEKYGFELSHIEKMMKALEEDLIDFSKSSVPITNVFNVLEKEKESKQVQSLAPKKDNVDDDIKKYEVYTNLITMIQNLLQLVYYNTKTDHLTDIKGKFDEVLSKDPNDKIFKDIDNYIHGKQFITDVEKQNFVKIYKIELDIVHKLEKIIDKIKSKDPQNSFFDKPSVKNTQKLKTQLEEIIKQSPKQIVSIKEKTQKSKPKTQTHEKDISDIKKMIDQVNSINVSKTKTPSKNISKVIEIADMISKTPKYKKKKNTTEYDSNISKVIDLAQMMSKEPKHKKSDIDTESKIVHESLSKIDKYLDKPKPVIKMPKVMQQAKGYEHKVYDVSPRVQNYVDMYKDIVNTGGNKGAVTRAINQLKLKVMTNMKASEVDDANKIISDFRKTLPPPVTQAKVAKAKAPKPDDGSYEGDKKYKPLTAYVKKHKPTITDPEDIHIIVVDLIDKKIPRMSVKKLNEVLEDLGY